MLYERELTRFAIACWSSVDIQLELLEVPGRERATSLGFSINDDTCEVTEIWLPQKPWWLSFLRCQRFVLSVRFLLQWVRSQSGVSANSLSLTSNETHFCLIAMHWILSKGVTSRSSLEAVSLSFKRWDGETWARGFPGVFSSPPSAVDQIWV